MKNYITTILMSISGFVFGQITIGKTTAASAPSSARVSIEFGNATGGAKGIVLPWVTNPGAVTTPTPGTLIFDSALQKVRFSRGATASATAVSEWVDLSAGAYTPVTPSLPDTNGENASAKVLLGGNPLTDSTSGILVLGDVDKAMVLPRVNSYTDILNPSAGMIVFVTGTTPNQLAVYNGREWSFWTKP